jgi:hypothetical protein
MPSVTTAWRHAYKATTKGRAKVLIGNAKQRCKEKNVQISITADWVEEHLKRGTCELTGLPFNFGPPPEGLTRRPDAPSLDRIDKHKHYTEDNTRVILWAVNCALAEYGTEVMLPILKAIVKGIEDAQQKSATSVSEGHHREGKIYPKLGIVLTSGAWQNYDHTYNHSRTIQWQDADSSPQASSRDSLGYGSGKVGASETSQSVQDNWYLNPAYGWIER